MFTRFFLLKYKYYIDIDILKYDDMMRTFKSDILIRNSHTNIKII